MRQKQPLALLSCDLHRKSVVPVVQNVPILQSVPDVEDVSEVIVLPELWRKTSVVVPDSPHRVVQPGVRRMDVVLFADDRQEYLDLLSQSAKERT
jgi:hypothetical protein